jgi:guanylate kinase
MKTIVTLTGPSCAGKSTLESKLKQAGFENVISTTTRPMRKGEVDGQSYYFVSREAFQKSAAEGAYIEQVEFNGNLYGVSACEVERVFARNKPVVVVVEPEGLRQVRNYGQKNGIRIVSVFVNNPDTVIADRFLRRMMGDFILNGIGSQEGAEKVIETYAKRMSVMMGEETRWAEQCAHLADVNLLWFNEENIKSVVDELLRMVYSPAHSSSNGSSNESKIAL